MKLGINKNVTLIKPIAGWVPINISEIWTYRQLLYLLAWREIKVRYKQTFLGIAWVIIQPFLMMLVFTLFFSKFIKIPQQNIPYPLFVYAGLLPWMFFSESISRCANSMIENVDLIKKVYFPRLIMPLSGIVSALIDLIFAFLGFLGLLLYFGFPITVKIFLLPVFLFFTMITALAVGLWLAAINVQYRDVRYIIPFLVQFWFFVSPVVYPATSLSKSWQLIYGLNPMAGVIEGFRWILLGTDPPGRLIIVSLAMVLVILISGVFYFRRMEKTFADVI